MSTALGLAVLMGLGGGAAIGGIIGNEAAKK